ncbi:MAG: hypothetical protein HYT03_00695 [Candidatus Harrisonbacteria bacterium]|nr:hypothetical protein [Candidatus Harrisonbacteria bacterium]
MLDNNKINSLIKTCLTGLTSRQKEVLEGRYGLGKTESLTLAELGSKYSLTRERIRQIESTAIKVAKTNANGDEFSGFKKAVNEILKNSGGTKREDLLIEELAGANAQNRVKFLLEICDSFQYANDGKDTHAFWHIGDDGKKKALSFVSYVLKNADRDDFSTTFVAAARNSGVSDGVARNYASISKNITTNVYGSIGLAEWTEINPKTARDWAYLILKKEKRPLHFTEIARLVSEIRGKKTHAPTIHNELIKDKKFVLVGKGTYTLSEFGVVAGTAKELISHFLKKDGPLSSREVINLVMKQRIFKENTILINLQNRKHFKRLGDGRYTTLV